MQWLANQPPENQTLHTNLNYLEKRQDQMHYPQYQQQGWPIGSGMVESANKLVVEARLKGSGMHWARMHVDPLLALRNIVCNDRWDEAWPQIVRTLRQQAQQRRTERRHQRRTARLAQPTAAVPSPPAVLPAHPSASANTPAAPGTRANTNEGPARHASSAPAQAQPCQPWRPPANHPWRHMPIGRARFKSSTQLTDAKP